MSLLAEFTESLSELEKEIAEEAADEPNVQNEDDLLAKPTKAMGDATNKWTIIEAITGNYLNQLVLAQT